MFGRVLESAKREENEISQWVLKTNSEVVPKRTTRPLREDEIHSETGIHKKKIFNKLIERR